MIYIFNLNDGAQYIIAKGKLIPPQLALMLSPSLFAVLRSSFTIFTFVLKSVSHVYMYWPLSLMLLYVCQFFITFFVYLFIHLLIYSCVLFIFYDSKLMYISSLISLSVIAFITMLLYMKTGAFVKHCLPKFVSSLMVSRN